MMHQRERFRRNDWPTLGVEIELQLVDAESMALKQRHRRPAGGPRPPSCTARRSRSSCSATSRSTPASAAPSTTWAATWPEVPGRRAVRRPLRRGLLWAATHPFSHWRDQQHQPRGALRRAGRDAPGDRRPARRLRPARPRRGRVGRPGGLGSATGSSAHLPVLLALSANSPFWCGRPTGLQSHRIEVLEGSPTGGLPPRMRSWGDYLELVDRLFVAGCIQSAKDLWWDVRPNPAYGTVEVRICDMPPDLPSVLGLTALIQCLVMDLSEEIDRRTALPEGDPLLDPAEPLAGLSLRPGGDVRRFGQPGGHAGQTGGRTAGRAAAPDRRAAGLRPAPRLRHGDGGRADRLGASARSPLAGRRPRRSGPPARRAQPTDPAGPLRCPARVAPTDRARASG